MLLRNAKTSSLLLACVLLTGCTGFEEQPRPSVMPPPNPMRPGAQQLTPGAPRPMTGQQPSPYTPTGNSGVIPPINPALNQGNQGYPISNTNFTPGVGNPQAVPYQVPTNPSPYAVPPGPNGAASNGFNSNIQSTVPTYQQQPGVPR